MIPDAVSYTHLDVYKRQVIISALSGVAGTYFIRPLINDYIVPLIGQQSPDLSGFISLILTVAAIYVAGVLATWAYQRIMLNISTGVLKKVRIEMYQHMIHLPLKYDDSQTHGELMSRYRCV